MESVVKLTIGIPFYNAERFLEFSIKSVLSQTFKEFELILSDDGSTDRSLEIAKSFNDPRIKVLSNKVNMGISVTLNEQVNVAKGEYFARMDADDLMFPDRIKKQFDILQNNPEIDVVGSYAIVIDDFNNIIGLRKTVIPDKIENCFTKIPLIHPSVTGKTDWFRKFKYSADFTGVEDRDLWIRSFSESNFFIIEEPLIFFRDPLEMRFDTYKLRTLQLKKLYNSNCNILGYNALYFKLRDSLKLSIFWIFKIFKAESVLVKKRNIYLDKKESANALLVIMSIINSKVKS